MVKTSGRAAKRILTKEKIDRQLAGQTDKLTSMMSKLTVQDDDRGKQLKPKIYQSKRR